MKNKIIFARFLIRLLFLTLLSALFSCSHSNEDGRKEEPLERASWLIGVWMQKTSRGIQYEQWNASNDTLLQGVVYRISPQDTLIIETISIIEEEGSLLYVPEVKNQNDGRAITFNQVDSEEHVLRFQQLEHDFPQFITYTRVSSDSLIAEISGKINGVNRSQTFPMKRIN